MMDKLHARGQDPNDPLVPASFTYRTFADVLKECLYNMDEMGSDTNRGRAKVVASAESTHDGLSHTFEQTDGDNNPFHVTNCLITCKQRRA